jgi:glycyl-tRNA synthetase beta chain
MVMDKDETVRNRRLSLLKTIADELRKLADFSKIGL